MRIHKIEINTETGLVHIKFIKELFDGEGNKVDTGMHVDNVNAGDKDKLIELLGQAQADAIESQYWTDEVLNQQETI